MKDYDFIVIGGGFFGSYISNFLTTIGKKVILVERNSDILLQASYSNQARVHAGYHYPRSLLTALRSRILFPHFCKEFEESIVDSFDNYYLIAKTMSKVSGRQFEQFCERIGASLTQAPQNIILNLLIQI